ncbi:MAG: AAA family ATPase [Anaerolineae bacterium]|jgi:DNA-binding SARP family transcriptional activator
MSDTQLRFLGPVQLARQDQPVELRAAKAIALLAYLAVTGVPQRREHLSDLLWMDSAPAAARKNLRNSLWAIRKVLGEESVHEPEPGLLALSETIRVDVHAFQEAVDAGSLAQWEAAVELYRGPFLEGLNLDGAPEFEIWHSMERERLGQIYLRLLERMIDARRAAADWLGVISAARQALTADNLQEPMYKARMEAHARLGERAEAERQYQHLREVLARELGVEPLPETEALRTAILAGDLPAQGARQPQPAPRSRAPAAARSRPFVGREGDLETLDQEWQLAAGGVCRVVLLTGELGIGKTRLWQEWSGRLPSESRVLESKCLDISKSLPYAPLTSLLGERTCLESLVDPASSLPEPWLVELARLMPGIRSLRPNLPAPPVLPPAEERHRLFEAFVQVLRALGDRSVVLFIDDVHWADQATLDWLVYLVDRMRDEPLLLFLAYRPHEAPAPLPSLAAAWKREGVARQVPLRRLTFEEAVALLQMLGHDVAQAEQAQTASAGNPYFLLELAQAPAGDTPPVLSNLIRARLSRLPSAARQVLQGAAILEEAFGFSVLRQTSGRGEEETLDALDLLLAEAILTERGEQFEFVHPLVAAVVREDLAGVRRRFLHRRAAAALESHYGSSGQLVRHYTGAGHPDQAAHYADRAAEQAQNLAAMAEAVDWRRRALELEPAPGRLLALGRDLAAMGELPEAREVLRHALAEFEVGDDGLGAARACLALADSYLPSGQGEQTIEWAARSLDALDVSSPPEDRANAYYLLGAGGSQTGCSLDEAERHLNQAARLAADHELPGMAARARFELGNLLAQRGDLEGAIRAFEEVISLASDAGDRFLEVLGHNNLAYHAHLAGDLEMAVQHIEAGLALADEFSLFVPRQYLYSTRGEIALAQGLLDEAGLWFERALNEAEKHQNLVQAANIRANLGLVERDRGDLEKALAHLQRARDMLDGVTAQHLHIQIDLWLADLHLRRGQRAAGAQSLAGAESRLAGTDRQALAAQAASLRAALMERADAV